MSDFETIQWAVEDWAEARNIIHGSKPALQMLKLTEEMGELAGAIAKDKSMYDVADALGDILVVLTILARQKRLDLTKCFERAYDEIKHRKGKMIGGVFIKESDLGKLNG